MSMVGELCVCDFDDLKLEWKIKDFLLYDYSYFMSPEFSFDGMSCHITIFPNGHNMDYKSVSIYIVSQSTTAPITVTFSFYLKTVDGKLYTDEKYTNTCVFLGNKMYGCNEFILRSKLMERKSELLPAGIFTVICILTKADTNVKTGSAIIDGFTKMEGGTGVVRLQKHWKEIFQNGNFSDVVLKVDNQEFKCHKCVLAQSPVFSAMMTHEMKEKNTGVVDIQDDDSYTFHDFLHYLYTGNKEILTPENVVKLYTTADKYQVDELKKSCFDYMLTNISDDNFCDVLSLSLVHVEKDLTDACSQFYIKHSLSIVKTPKWLEFMMKHPVAANELYIKRLESNVEIKN